jgi:hypothetical protein
MRDLVSTFTDDFQRKASIRVNIYLVFSPVSGFAGGICRQMPNMKNVIDTNRSGLTLGGAGNIVGNCSFPNKN